MGDKRKPASPNKNQFRQEKVFWESDRKTKYYTLLDAMIWVASQGSPITHERIAQGIFDEDWAGGLFDALKENRLVATGIDPVSGPLECPH